ncbi:MAG TPA: hypothetical protein VIW24_19485 [Aldersonia sp.]
MAAGLLARERFVAPGRRPRRTPSGGGAVQIAAAAAAGGGAQVIEDTHCGQVLLGAHPAVNTAPTPSSHAGAAATALGGRAGDVSVAAPQD